jgi:ppGpp synthetase/RelA/SpoT-type nucleotidyltranferase
MNLTNYIDEFQPRYATFAKTVAAIVQSAIDNQATNFHVQQIQTRAKSVDSLERKLRDRGLLASEAIESEIKDLAGCRLILYTNSDVDRFLQSGLIFENFVIDWDASKIHHPTATEPTVEELYMGMHYVVRLTPARLALPEYARFANMRCEIQIQTILNHAWSESSHDIIYKRPDIKGFGTRQFDAISKRMARIMREHLLPAGYEFQKVQDDYERLMQGKELFDRGAIEALEQSADNNDRNELLARIREHIIPYYDDPASVYPDLRRALTSMIKKARETKQRAIETPFGTLPGKSGEAVTTAALEILEYLRYVDVEGTFEALCEILPGAAAASETKRILRTVEELATNDLEIWKQSGPVVQALLVAKSASFDSEARQRLRPVIWTVCSAALDPNLESTSFSFDRFTISQGAVVPGEVYAKIRAQAIDLLTLLYQESAGVAEKRVVIERLLTATRLPSHAGYTDEFCAQVMRDSRRIVEFFGQCGNEPYEILEHLEHRFLFLYRRARQLLKRDDFKKTAADAEALMKSLVVFRDALNADAKFVRYKTLVGYESVFKADWDREDEGYHSADDYRKAQFAEYIAAITDETAAEWWEFIELCAATQSDDMATFPIFGEFLRELATARPGIVLRYLVDPNEKVMSFLPDFLAGLAASDRSSEAVELMGRWVKEGRYLSAIARHLRYSSEANLDLMKALLKKAIEVGETVAAIELVVSVISRRASEDDPLVRNIFLPGLTFLTSKEDTRWIDIGWYLKENEAFLQNVSGDSVTIVLQNLVYRPDIDYRAEWVLSLIASRHPDAVWKFFGERISRERTVDTRDSYKAIPYELRELSAPLSANPERAVDVVWEWYNPDDPYFRFDGGRLLAIVFPNFPQAFSSRLILVLNTHKVRGADFVIAILQNFHGQPFLHSICRELIRQLPENDKRIGQVDIILQGTGVVMGEFGLVEAYKRKKEEISPWLEDSDPKVRAFAERYSRELDRAAAAEQRRSEQDHELRRRRYEEP